MSLTPQQVYEIQFSKAIRGYDSDDVDRFLDMVIGELERRDAEEAKLKQQLAELQEKYEKSRELESAIRDTLVLAQRRSEEILRDAQMEAEQIRGQAQQEAARIKLEVSALPKAIEQYREKIRNSVNELNDLLDEQQRIALPQADE